MFLPILFLLQYVFTRVLVKFSNRHLQAYAPIELDSGAILQDDALPCNSFERQHTYFESLMRVNLPISENLARALRAKHICNIFKNKR